MPRRSGRTDEIATFVVGIVEEHPADLARVVAERFGVSRQTVVSQLNRMIMNGVIEAEGRTKARRYSLKKTPYGFVLDVSPLLEEDVVWRERLLPELRDLPDNVVDICNYGFTEMLNNVVDHAESDKATVLLIRDALQIRILVADAGIGIFNKIQRTFGLHDPRHALLELAKGKLTTDERGHSGEGVFFTSRSFDEFIIASGSMFYRRLNKQDDDWLIDAGEQSPTPGTTIDMTIRVGATHTLKEVFDRHASEDGDYGFTRTHVPIRLAMYGGEQMLSRSQAKRILARVDRFREVMLDFRGVTGIGQAFADEIFRVFAGAHPEVRIVALFTTPGIDNMIARAKSAQAAEPIEPQQLSLLSPDDAQE